MILPKKILFLYNNKHKKVLQCLNVHFFSSKPNSCCKNQQKCSVAVIYHFSTKHNSGHRVNGRRGFFLLSCLIPTLENSCSVGYFFCQLTLKGTLLYQNLTYENKHCCQIWRQNVEILKTLNKKPVQICHTPL